MWAVDMIRPIGIGGRPRPSSRRCEFCSVSLRMNFQSATVTWKIDWNFVLYAHRLEAVHLLCATRANWRPYHRTRRCILTARRLDGRTHRDGGRTICGIKCPRLSIAHWRLIWTLGAFCSCENSGVCHLFWDRPRRAGIRRLTGREEEQSSAN